MSERDNESVLRVYKPDDNELVHTALKLRSNILTQPGHKGLDISEDAEMSCIPGSPYPGTQVNPTGHVAYFNATVT